MTDYCFIIDNTAPDLAQIRTDCFLRNAISSGNSLNMIDKVSLYADERLIEIAGGNDSNWRENLDWFGTSIVLWHGMIEDPLSEEIINAWRLAQRPSFDSNHDQIPDTALERHNNWFNLIG